MRPKHQSNLGKTYRKRSEWVLFAEKLAVRHGGKIPNPQWLINNDLWGLYAQLLRNPKDFAHIPRNGNIRTSTRNREFQSFLDIHTRNDLVG